MTVACSSRTRRNVGATTDAGDTDFGMTDVDASSTDAGRLDSGTADAGAMDAGHDSGVVDAGHDSGVADSGTLDAGHDSGVIDAGHDLGVVDAGPVLAEVFFPTSSDSFSETGEHLWDVGSDVSGSRTLPAGTYGHVTVHAVMSYNMLTCDNESLVLSINGADVGTITITPSTTSLDQTFAFSSISGGGITLRYRNVVGVAGGCGSARFDTSASSLDFAL